VLQEFVTRVPRQIQALLRLSEVCVEGGLESTMYEAQAELADAYLATGQAAEARGIAEDLVAREPWERAHLERFRRALVMLRVDDPDSVIAERLSGLQPFTARDMFAAEGSVSTEWESTPASEVAFPEPAADLPPETPAPEASASGAEPEPDAGQTEWAALPDSLGESKDAGSENETGDSEAFAAVFGQSGGRPASEPDAETAEDHMALARTYLEMSMPDEAVEPLKEAFKTPQFRFEAAAHLGRVYQRRGDVPQAIEWLERAAGAPAPTRDEGHAVLYDLGALIERSGDTARALALFLELQADAGVYRDVTERVEFLTRVETGG
jgi:tetratricopeptide (TPR) repeat protein